MADADEVKKGMNALLESFSRNGVYPIYLVEMLLNVPPSFQGKSTCRCVKGGS